MSLPRLIATAVGLWAAARTVSGLRIGDDLALLPMMGTLAVVALLWTTVYAVCTGLRHRIWQLWSSPVPVVGALLLTNGALFWATAALAQWAGLAVNVTGFLPALCGSLIVPIVSGALLTVARGPRGHV